MYFRPLPILTLFAVPVFAALVALGVWQIQRAGWKADVIQRFEETAEAAPLSPDAACEEGLTAGQVVVPLAGEGPTLRMFGHNTAGDAGWRLFQVASLCGREVFVESGFEALDIGGPGGQMPPGARAQKAIDRYVVEPWPEKSAMAAGNAAERNEWHWFDAVAMGRTAAVSDFDARFIVTPYAGVPTFLSRTPPETHIGYAVTWFGMAVAFLVIYAMFHARAGRLRIGRAKA